jgi:hypothetical protein
VFGDEALGLRFDFGLRVNTSFGVISPTLTPIQTHKLTSIGTSPIQCTTQITRTVSEDPYGFTVELKLSCKNTASPGQSGGASAGPFGADSDRTFTSAKQIPYKIRRRLPINRANVGL